MAIDQSTINSFGINQRMYVKINMNVQNLIFRGSMNFSVNLNIPLVTGFRIFFRHARPRGSLSPAFCQRDWGSRRNVGFDRQWSERQCKRASWSNSSSYHGQQIKIYVTFGASSWFDIWGTGLRSPSDTHSVIKVLHKWKVR